MDSNHSLPILCRTEDSNSISMVFYFDSGFELLFLLFDFCLILLLFIECTGDKCKHTFGKEELYLEVAIQEKDMSTVDGKFKSKAVRFCPHFECLLNPKDHTRERKYPPITRDTPIFVSSYFGVTSTEGQLLEQNKFKLLQYF